MDLRNIFGFVGGLSLSNKDIPGSVLGNRTNYTPYGSITSLAQDGYVIPDEVAASVTNGWRLGEGLTTPLALFYDLFRTKMADVAREWAHVYNARTDCEIGRSNSSSPDPIINQFDC